MKVLKKLGKELIIKINEKFYSVAADDVAEKVAKCHLVKLQDLENIQEQTIDRLPLVKKITDIEIIEVLNNELTPQRGGVRKGAGRKALGTINCQIRTTPKEKELIVKYLAKLRGKEETKVSIMGVENGLEIAVIDRDTQANYSINTNTGSVLKTTYNPTTEESSFKSNYSFNLALLELFKILNNSTTKLEIDENEDDDDYATDIINNQDQIMKKIFVVSDKRDENGNAEIIKTFVNYQEFVSFINKEYAAHATTTKEASEIFMQYNPWLRCLFAE